MITAGKYKGQRAIEVRLDGNRVGELTYLMSQRYAPVVTQVNAHGGHAGCEAVIERDAKGLQLTLRLPRDAYAVPVAPSTVVISAAAAESTFTKHRKADETTTTVADLPTTTTTTVAQPPPPQPTTEQPVPPPPAAADPAPQQECDPNYSGCVPIASDVDCAGGSGNGPAYVEGPVRVVGEDIYDLDRDGNGTACE